MIMRMLRVELTKFSINNPDIQKMENHLAAGRTLFHLFQKH
jgi:hypothetical protein